MGELDFLRDLVVVFGVSIGIVYAFDALRLPALVGFLAAGALLGPYGLDVVHDAARVEVFAKIGVVLLLFTIGVEFSLTHIRSLRATVTGCSFLGNCIHVEARLESGEAAIAEVSRLDGGFHPGEAVHLWWQPADELTFEDD